MCTGVFDLRSIVFRADLYNKNVLQDTMTVGWNQYFIHVSTTNVLRGKKTHPSFERYYLKIFLYQDSLYYRRSGSLFFFTGHF